MAVMMALCRQLRPVDISAVLPLLATTNFHDTGGTNGWIAYPPWLSLFVVALDVGTAVYAVCRKLPAYQGIPPHVDRGELDERRYHIPLITHPDVLMRWPDDDFEIHLKSGYLYEVDFLRLHEIVHRAPIDRIHIQVNVRGI